MAAALQGVGYQHGERDGEDEDGKGEHLGPHIDLQIDQCCAHQHKVAGHVSGEQLEQPDEAAGIDEGRNKAEQ